MDIRRLVLLAAVAFVPPASLFAQPSVKLDVSTAAARIQASHINEASRSRTLRDAAFPGNERSPWVEEQPNTRQDATGEDDGRSATEPLGGNAAGDDVPR